MLRESQRKVKTTHLTCLVMIDNKAKFLSVFFEGKVENSNHLKSK